MIQNLDVDQGQRSFQAAGQQLVSTRLVNMAARVVMGEDDSPGVMPQRGTDDFARIDRRGVQGSQVNSVLVAIRRF